MRKNNDSGFVIYSKFNDSPYTSLRIGENKIYKEDIKSLFPDLPATFLEKISEEHICDIFVDPATNQIEVKNYCKELLNLRICSFSKPILLTTNSSHVYSKMTQLSLSYDFLSPYILNIKKLPNFEPKKHIEIPPKSPIKQIKTQKTESKKHTKRRLRKLVDLIEKNKRAWENLGESSFMCVICLRELGDTVGKVDCGHMFCPECIKCWSDQATYCPLCKKPYKFIRMECEGKLIEKVKVEEKQFESPDEAVDVMYCYECHNGNDEDKLLICDECDTNCCHTYCDHLDSVPENAWLCKFCRKEFEDLFNEKEEEIENFKDEKMGN